jgi:hypothetical protein
MCLCTGLVVGRRFYAISMNYLCYLRKKQNHNLWHASHMGVRMLERGFD